MPHRIIFPILHPPIGYFDDFFLLPLSGRLLKHYWYESILSHYNSLIVSVIAMLCIRLAGPWTATIHENITSKIIIPIVLNGMFQPPPK